MRISVAFAKIADLAKRLNVSGIGKLNAPWEHRLSADWEFAVNGKVAGAEWRGMTIPPFGFIALRNGFPALVGDAHGGSVIGGVKIEDEFIAQLDAAARLFKERALSVADEVTQ